MKMILSLQFLLTAASCKTSINILHFNDVHSRVEPANRFASSCSSNPTSPECFGGMARQKTVIDQIRNSSSYPTIVLDAGDEFMGTLWNTFYQGDAAAELQNLMELDAMELGNHEFDFGEDVLLDYLRQLEIPVLGACNIITNNTELAGLIQKWTIKKFPSFKVGIVGALTTDTSFSSNPGPQTKFQDLVPSLNDCILEMKSQENVDIVIALTHVGIFEDEKIAKNVEGVDMVIGGHTHTFLYSPTDNTPILLLDEDGEEKRDTAFADYPVMFDSVVTQGKKVPVFQAYWANRYMGNFIATFDDKFNLIEIEGQPILLNDTIDFDPEAQEIIDELKVPLATYSQNIIGKTSVLLDGAREVVRSTESSLGNSICDGILWYINNRLPEFEQDFGAVDIAVQNGGGIRASIEQGDISVGNVQEVLPFGNTVSITAMSGVDIIGMSQDFNCISRSLKTKLLMATTQLI
eukprot:TRINITY_DN5117_c0_g1_i14.p1 TRINITY_DN5117_c0_g1~~TRINITY_DN5117_c0_g1_i14.p1  ORF type:complete len:464 (-),score=82.92 TRINITY_DN5117_c0_g1_i14:2370-3761(-)